MSYAQIKKVVCVCMGGILFLNQTGMSVELGVLRAAQRANSDNKEDATMGTPTPNTAPTISKIADRTLPENGVAIATFLVNDAETPGESLKVEATSDNPLLVPDLGLTVNVQGRERTLMAVPARETEGKATITVTVTDRDGTQAATDFSITVTNDLPYVPGELLVRVRKGVDPASVQWTSMPSAGRAASAQAAPSIRPLLPPPPPSARAASQSGPTPARAARIPQGGSELAAQSLENLQRTFVIAFDPNQDIQHLMEMVQRQPGIESVELNHVARIETVNDPDFVSGNLWGLNKIQAPAAWDNSPKGEGVVVAVLDTGIDMTHPDLASNIWSNPGEIAGNGIDDDQNGYVDDVHGWNFVSNSNIPADGGSHGTHVSGTIAAVGNNGIGVIGVAYKAKIMPLKGLNDLGEGDTSGLIRGLIYAANNGADVINNSWGGPFQCTPDSNYYDAVNYVYGQGVVVVAAAGNSNSDVVGYSPAGCPNVITVAATDSNDAKASFSNWGQGIDVAAPGVGILSTSIYDGYVTYRGTSMACPHVAGVVALILSKFPTLANYSVSEILRSSADDLGTPGFDTYFGFGRINAHKAVLPPNDNVNPSTPTNLTLVVADQVKLKLTWSASTDNERLSGYLLDVSTSPIFSSFVNTYKSHLIGNRTNFLIENLPAESTFYVRLRAIDLVGNVSGFSETKSASTPRDTNPPTVPTNFRLRLSLSPFPSLWGATWGESTDNFEVAGYKIDISTSPNFSTFVDGYHDRIVKSRFESIFDLPFRKYYSRIRAFDASGNTSGYAVDAQVYADMERPILPRSLAVRASGSSSLDLIFPFLPNNDIYAYCVEISTHPSFSSYSRRAVDPSSAGEMRLLEPNTGYYVRVRATDNAWNMSGYSTTHFIRTTPPPPPPTNLKMESFGPGELFLNWKAPIHQGNVYYLLEVSENVEFTTFVPGYTNKSIYNPTFTEITGLKPGIEYFVRLRSAEDRTTSTYSETVKATTLMKDQPPTIVIQPTDQSSEVYSPATFRVVAGGSGPLTYQWQKNGVNIPGETYNTFTSQVKFNDNGALFRVVVSNSAGSVTSATARLSVTTTLRVIESPQDQMVILGRRATFIYDVEGSDPMTYQWSKNGVNIPGATNPSYTTPPTRAADNGAVFTVIARNGGGATARSSATLNIILPPAISTQPANRSAEVNTSATFRVVATGAGPLTYQWQKNGVNIPGATGSTYTFPTTNVNDNGALFKVIVRNRAGSVTSDTARLSITTYLRVIQSPQDQSVIVGRPATFTYRVEGSAPMTYQWSKNGVNIPGATNPSYTTPPTRAADNGAVFTVIARNGGGATATSSAKLSVRTR